MIVIEKIGIIDSGLGGINVLKYLLDLNKKAEYIYYGDYKNNPYGNKTEQELKKYYQDAINFLKKKKCNKVIVACNTLSTIVNDESITPIKYVEDEITKYSKENILLLATEMTIKSNIYSVQGVSCKMFVPFIENNLTNQLDQYLDLYLKKYKDNKDIIILGCTHYTMLKDMILNYFNKDITFIDSSYLLAKNANINGDVLKIDIYLTKIYVSSIKNIQKILKNYDFIIHF